MEISVEVRNTYILELTAVSDDDGLLQRARLGAETLDLLDKIHTFSDLAENNVLAVQPGCNNGGDEELGAVGVGARVGHGEETFLGVLLDEVLISKLGAVDRYTTGSILVGKVTTLEHKLRNDSMEGASLVGEVSSLLASAESAEVFAGLGSDVRVELEHDATGLFAADGQIEENFGLNSSHDVN